METIPLVNQLPNIETNLRFELHDRLLGEDVGDNLALACMLCAIAGVEDASANGDEGIVEF